MGKNKQFNKQENKQYHQQVKHKKINSYAQLIYVSFSFTFLFLFIVCVTIIILDVFLFLFAHFSFTLSGMHPVHYLTIVFLFMNGLNWWASGKVSGVDMSKTAHEIKGLK